MHDTNSSSNRSGPVDVELVGDRPSSACILCPPPKPGRRAWTPVDRGYRCCSDCYDKIRDRLADLARRWLILDPRPGAAGETGSRGAPGFGSRPPASPHVIAMTDWRSASCEVSFDDLVYVWDPLADTVLEPGQCGPPGGAYVERREVWRGRDGRAHTEQPNPVRSIPKALAGWCETVAAERDIATPRTRDPIELTRWLDRHLDWVTRQGWVDEFDEDLRALQRQLKPVTGDPPATRFGACPNVVDEETQTLCGASLRTPNPGSDTITCTSCGRQWKRPDWEHLGRLIQHQRMHTLHAAS